MENKYDNTNKAGLWDNSYKSEDWHAEHSGKGDVQCPKCQEKTSYKFYLKKVAQEQGKNLPKYRVELKLPTNNQQQEKSSKYENIFADDIPH